MALDANEKVYQSDMQHITPMADAAIYGYDGNWILRGLELIIGSGTVTLTAGQAILQGRLYELSADKIVDTSGLTGTIYIGLRADLSLTNTETTNAQFTLEATNDAPSGNLLTGDIQAFIGLYSFTGTVVTKLVLNYKADANIVVNSPQLVSGANLSMVFNRIGHQLLVRYYWAANSFQTLSTDQITIMKAGTIPREFIGFPPNNELWGMGPCYFSWESIVRWPYISGDGSMVFRRIVNKEGAISGANLLTSGTSVYSQASFFVYN